MCLRFLEIAAIGLGIASFSACALRSGADAGRVLKVCSDPNNLPFSNQQREGFENRIAELLARHMQARLEYTWFPQRRGFLRNTLNAGRCDVLMGAPTGLDLVDATRPYYRSTYVFAARQDKKFSINSLDDPLLRALEIGVHVIGGDSNPPPLHALARRHLTSNIAAYSIFGDYSQPNPPARLIDAAASGEIDVAIAWGPVAGYFARRQPVRLTITAISPEADSSLPFAYDISLAVRKGETVLRQRLNLFLDRNQEEIDRILSSYGVPTMPLLRTVPQ